MAGELRLTGGKWRNHRLSCPKRGVRPSSSILRQAIFNICQSIIPEGRVLDLFAGSGAVGLEALSRGASSVTFAERDRQTISVLRQNIEELGTGASVTIYPQDALRVLKKLNGQKFDLIYVDPPYQAKGPWKGGQLALSDAVLMALEEMEEPLLSPHGYLLLEDEGLGEAPDTLRYILKSSRNFGRARLRQFTLQDK